jgi:chromosome segregation ATPase
VVEQRRLKSVEEARVNTNAELSEARRDLEQRLLEAEERAAAAEDRIRDAEAEAREARAEEERALQEYEELSERVSPFRSPARRQLLFSEKLELTAVLPRLTVPD